MSSTERTPLIDADAAGKPPHGAVVPTDDAENGSTDGRGRSRSVGRDGQVVQRRPEDEAAKALLDKPEPWTRADVLTYGLWTLLAVAFSVWAGYRISGRVDIDWHKTLMSALGGGLAGAAAMVIQVLTLMPLRTVMNYQYRYGTSLKEASRALYEDGGFPRYYAGLGAALFQGPIARFGDTAANAGIKALIPADSMPSFLRTAFASTLAALFRMTLTPIDTVKTTMQTQGQQGWALLRNRVKVHGIGTLWYGAFGTAAATFVGHYPWQNLEAIYLSPCRFGTYNFLEDHLPKPDTFLQLLGRQALMGFCASVVSDTISNSLRVVKTYRQVNATKISYRNAARAVIAADGLRGLFGRGLATRILANGLQGLLFSVLWKLFQRL
ncbi:mitochondrial carrier [Auriculariales sp. MPI-PUGE-AT-0066]|nr:mitochondrial carrier [Auriculariales sp. MPI-PUGE-AT-0066]